MSTSLLADHKQAFEFKNPPSLAPADHHYHAPSSPTFQNSSLSDNAFASNLHTLNRPSDLQSLSLDPAQFPSRLYSFNGDLQMSQAPQKQQLTPTFLGSFAGDPQRGTARSLHLAPSQADHSISASHPSCATYAGTCSSSASTPRSCSSTASQKDTNDGDAFSPVATLRAPDCDFAERIHELRAALLRRRVSRPDANLMQNSCMAHGEAQENKWAAHQPVTGSRKDDLIRASFLRKTSHLQACKQDNGGDAHDYLGSLRAAASAFGGITYQTDQEGSRQGSNFFNRASQLCVGSPKQGDFTDQVMQGAFSGVLDQVSLAGAGLESQPDLGGLHDIQQAVAGPFKKIASQASAAHFCSQAGNLQSAASVNGFSQACSTSSVQYNQSNLESSVGSCCVDQFSEESTLKGSVDEAKVQGTARTSGFSQDNCQTGHCELSAADPPSVSLSGYYSQAGSMGGFGKVNQASAISLGQVHQDSAGSDFSSASHDSICSYNSEANKAIAGSYYANQVSEGGVNQALLLMKERCSESGDVQAPHFKCCSNGEFTELERFQVDDGEAAGASDELLQADGSFGDFQASVGAQEGFQKFLPSNGEDELAEEEMQLGGALFGCDEFRMYEFKVRLCMRERSHDWTQCPFAHPGEKARRRDPRIHHYSAVPCPDFRKAACKRGDACELSHGVFECWLHPSRYRTQICKDGKLCKRKVCFFAHTPSQFRAISSNSSSQIQNILLPNMSLPLAQASDLSAIDGSSPRLPMQLVQHVDPRYYQALLKQENYATQLTNHHLNIYPDPNSIYNHLRHTQQGGAEAAAVPPISYDGCPLRLAVTYGLPLNLEAGASLEGLHPTPSNGHLAVSPQSLNVPPRIEPLYDVSPFLQNANAASANGLSCVKGTLSTNYPNLATYNGISMHAPGSYGATPNLQSDGSRVRALQTAQMDAITRQHMLSEALALGIHNRVATQNIGLPNSGFHLPLVQSSAPMLSPTDTAFQRMPSNFAGWNNPLLQRTTLLNSQAAQSMDTVSHAQAVLAAHALAQNLPSSYHAHTTPSTPMSPQARQHLDGSKAAVNPLSTQLNHSGLANEPQLQTAVRSLDSPQAMNQLVACIQQLEMRCANAEMKNSLMMAQAAFMNKAKTHQRESWDGHENEGMHYQRTDRVESMKGERSYGVLQQDAPATLMPDQRGSSLDLGWVNELV